MTSNLVRGKGHEYVMEAMPRILRMFPRTRLVIAGRTINGDNYDIELRRRSESLRLTESVTFAGWQDDIARFLGDIDILIDASCLPEGYRHTIVEAMQAGVPVIATNVGPAREIIRTAAEGMIVPPRDAESLADAVCTLLENPCRMREIARNGRRAAVEQRRSDDGTTQMERLYRTTALSRRG
jgi:glycosyltransferase involved in cell wall biosynthesis